MRACGLRGRGFGFPTPAEPGPARLLSPTNPYNPVLTRTQEGSDDDEYNKQQAVVVKQTIARQVWQDPPSD